MRRRILPFDVWVCLALAVLVAMGTGALAEKLANQVYEAVEEDRKPMVGEIGGPAGEEVFRAQSVEDLLSHETFTVVSPGIEYRNRGGGYHSGKYFQALTLPSGERVAAWINSDSVQEVGGYDYYSSDKVLPLGQLVYEDLSGDSYFLGQIEHSEELSRHDFYIDMVGGSAILDKEQATELPKILTQLATVAVLFPLLHMAGSKLGIFPAYFRKKSKPEWE